MNKEIKYSGHTAVPSDYQSPDGDLTLSINLINEDGALRPVPPPRPQGRFADNLKPLLIHHVTEQQNFILSIQVNGKTEFRWCERLSEFTLISEEDTHAISIPGITDYRDIAVIGNTVTIGAGDGLHYILWQNGSYKYLGQKPPFIPIEFGSVVDAVRDSDWTPAAPSNIKEVQLPDDFASLDSNAKQKAVLDMVYGFINPIIAYRRKIFQFHQPFFVRYAFRLYDGSYAWHSAPVLIMNTVLPPMIELSHDNGSASFVPDIINAGSMRSRMQFFNLVYRILEDHSDMLQNWSDIISSVDIFITPEILSYNPNEFKHDTVTFVCRRDNKIKELARLGIPTDAPLGEKILVAHYGDGLNKPYSDFRDHYADVSESGPVIVDVKLNESFHLQMQSAHTFYKVAEIKLAKVKAMPDMELLKFDDFNLDALISRPTLTDDYLSHALVIPSSFYSFNNRLNVVSEALIPAKPLPARSLMQLNAPADSPSSDWAIISIWSKMNGVTSLSFRFEISQISDPLAFEADGSFRFPRFIFWPDPAAFKMEFNFGNEIKFRVDLIRHDFLNGAYYYNPDLRKDSHFTNADELTGTFPIKIPNYSRVYTSDPDNPFYFPASGIIKIGNARIHAVSTAARALSQGQFGQFPLYAFTSEGVWALEITSSGNILARQPITRDVCTDPAAITQIDSAVLFPTDRGIMLISGSQTSCISDAINTDYPFNPSDLPGFNKLHDMLGHDSDTCLPVIPFSQFLRHCKMIYDYVHQRVIVYAPAISYAYVYSLKSRLWGMTLSDIAGHLNSYPEALAVDNQNRIVNFSDLIDGPVNALCLTRPLKLDAPDILKTVTSVIQRGQFPKGAVQSVLYASRDLINWHLVWSSRDHYLRGFRGTPYKYFRIALLARLHPSESILGASIQFTPRLTNQPR